jgi:hypothetical protein
MEPSPGKNRHSLVYTQLTNLLYLYENGNFMPEIVVKYKDKRTLEALQDLAKYFDYEISSPNLIDETEKQISLNGITLIPADSTVDTTGLAEIFTGKNIDPSELRKEAWQRRK